MCSLFDDRCTSVLRPDYSKPIKHSTIHKFATKGSRIFKPSNSSVSSRLPLHLVQKKDRNDWRPCDDFKPVANCVYIILPEFLSFMVMRIQVLYVRMHACDISFYEL
uniref:Uncharacterized protein n=1 Tax=Glossina palpalis gambiensis TaxID=67801 RepID=A0A1B0AYE5_9MUSC